MNFKQGLKSYLLHLKERWFVYIIFILVFVILWFIIFWGNFTKVPANQELFIWFTPNREYQSLQPDSPEYIEAEKNYNKAYGIITFLNGKRDEYGYKEVGRKIADVSKTNSDQLNVYASYADQGDVDIFIMPTSCYKNDEFTMSNGEPYPSASERINDSNQAYCMYYISIEDLFASQHEDYSKYQVLLAENTSRHQTYRSIDYNENMETRTVGIKINSDYVLSISKYHTTNNQTLYKMIEDIIAYINMGE